MVKKYHSQDPVKKISACPHQRLTKNATNRNFVKDDLWLLEEENMTKNVQNPNLRDPPI
jgi:hypothetical protein